MILHIMPDDKFLDYAIHNFEITEPDNNRYLIEVKDKDNYHLKYIKSNKVELINSQELSSTVFLNSLQDYEFVILHYLTYNKAQMIRKASDNVIFVWFGWGADYYPFITGSDQELYLNVTYRLWKKKNFFRYLKNIIKNITKKIIPDQQSEILNILPRINFFAPVLYEDYLLAKKKINNLNAQYLSFIYGNVPIEDLKNKALGKNILLGNSSTYTNNHFEVFESLKKFDLTDRKVIVPLSYGDMDYQKEVIAQGEKLLGCSFIPLTNFMEIDEYIEMVSSCSIVIMNHLRQQGVGNILMTMGLGAKIYLNPESTVYQFFKHQNAFIYSIDEVSLENSNVFTQLTESEIEYNHSILLKHFGQPAIEEKVRTLIKTVRDSKNVRKADNHQNDTIT